LKSLKKIFIKINNSEFDEYSKLDLKQFFPEKDFNKYKKVKIYKFGHYFKHYIRKYIPLNNE
jgi:hypothetical protein